VDILLATMEKKVFVLVLFSLLLNFTGATIIISEPADIYNLGDKIYINVEGIIGANSGNFNIELQCGTNTTINLVKIPARAFSAEKEQSYSLPYKVLDKEDLEIQNLSDILGNCQITSSLGSQASATKFFTITNTISVNAKLDKVAYDPGQPMTLIVEAVKANGQPLEGFVTGTNATDFSKEIISGSLKEIIATSETSEPGPYVLEITAYDSGSEGLLNYGKTTVSFIVNQIPSSIIASLSDQTVIPGNSLKMGVEVFDQSGKKMEGGSIVRLISPLSEEVAKEVKSGENVVFDFPLNATAGVWKSYVIFETLVEEREFVVAELQKVEFDIIDSILQVTNVGNVLYNKSIDVDIGEEKKKLDLNIEVGETRKFNLRAPQGEYEVFVGDGDNSISRQVILTGNAISIKDLERVGIFKGYSIVWLFLLLILFAIGFVWFRRHKTVQKLQESKFVSRVRSVGEAFRNKVGENVPGSVRNSMNDSMNLTTKSPVVQGLDSSNLSHEDKSMVDLTKKGQAQHAETSVTMKGDNYHSAVIAVNVKNYASLNENSKTELGKIINSSKDSKGLVDWRGDYIFVVFSPIITKTYHNEAMAIKSATKILNELKNHNKKYNNKVEFNIGVHCGELLASKSEGKLKYTSLGNTISFAKRIADSDKEKLLVSDEVRKKLLRELKTQKIRDIGSKGVYEVIEVKNKEANEAKLKDILHRIEEKKEE
jgi:class 3 adenylate cyclase